MLSLVKSARAWLSVPKAKDSLNLSFVAARG